MGTIYYETQEEQDDAFERQMELIQYKEHLLEQLEVAENEVDYARDSLKEAEGEVEEILKELAAVQDEII